MTWSGSSAPSRRERPQATAIRTCRPSIASHEIGEREALADHLLADQAGDRSFEARAGVDERVELAVLAARIDSRGQLIEERRVVLAAGERRVEPARVDADDIRL